jgi:cell wall-associated NlpC family hydrolase
MTRRLGLVVLVLVLGWTWIAGPGGALAAPGDSAEMPWTGDRRLTDDLFQTPLATRAAPAPSLGARAARYARRLLGVPYRYGGDSPGSGFDCSGLVRYVFGHFGVDLPHSSYADYGLGRQVSRGSLRPGDLVFFDGVGHVGLYVGAGRFIHAPHSGTTVTVASLNDPWYSARYDGARRVMRALRGGTRR